MTPGSALRLASGVSSAKVSSPEPLGEQDALGLRLVDGEGEQRVGHLLRRRGGLLPVGGGGHADRGGGADAQHGGTRHQRAGELLAGRSVPL